MQEVKEFVVLPQNSNLKINIIKQLELQVPISLSGAIVEVKLGTAATFIKYVKSDLTLVSSAADNKEVEPGEFPVEVKVTVGQDTIEYRLSI